MPAPTCGSNRIIFLGRLLSSILLKLALVIAPSDTSSENLYTTTRAAIRTTLRPTAANDIQGFKSDGALLSSPV
jgi:hypothetical protein